MNKNSIDERLIRTRILIGDEGILRLQACHVLVAGLGGVGGAVAEALARAGIGHLSLLDHDVVSGSNMNRQIIALKSTIGQPKVQVMAQRLRDIAPDMTLTLHSDFLQPRDATRLISQGCYDYVADCIDSIACKSALVAACLHQKIRVISALGAGNRLDVRRVRITVLNQTHGCGLARELRAQLRLQGVALNYPVVWSDEAPRDPLPHQPLEGATGRARAVNGTISYLPPLFGLMLAGVVIEQLLDIRK